MGNKIYGGFGVMGKLSDFVATPGLFRGNNGERGDSANGGDDIFRVNKNILNSDVTIENDENASCAGPLTVASGVTLTVASGGTLVIT